MASEKTAGEQEETSVARANKRVCTYVCVRACTRECRACKVSANLDKTPVSASMAAA